MVTLHQKFIINKKSGSVTIMTIFLRNSLLMVTLHQKFFIKKKSLGRSPL